MQGDCKQRQNVTLVGESPWKGVLQVRTRVCMFKHMQKEQTERKKYRGEGAGTGAGKSPVLCCVTGYIRMQMKAQMSICGCLPLALWKGHTR